MRTKGFCSALLRCGEIKLIAEKHEYAISVDQTRAARARSAPPRSSTGKQI